MQIFKEEKVCGWSLEVLTFSMTEELFLYLAVQWSLSCWGHPHTCISILCSHSPLSPLHLLRILLHKAHRYHLRVCCCDVRLLRKEHGKYRSLSCMRWQHAGRVGVVCMRGGWEGRLLGAKVEGKFSLRVSVF